jgi:hypothetical protein
VPGLYIVSKGSTSNEYSGGKTLRILAILEVLRAISQLCNGAICDLSGDWLTVLDSLDYALPGLN